MREDRWELIRVVGFSLCVPGFGHFRQERYRAGAAYLFLSFLAAGFEMWMDNSGDVGLWILLMVFLPVISSVDVARHHSAAVRAETASAETGG